MIIGLDEIDYLIFSAEKREVSPFLRNADKINEKTYVTVINNKKILIIITGVGKNAIKKSLKTHQELLNQIKPNSIFNLGNAGALIRIPSATILKIGICSGNNGKETIVIDNINHTENISVNSLQNKKKLSQQFPNASTVDMELFHLAKAYPSIISYKIIIDTFRLSPKTLLFKLLLPLIVRKNSKLLYTFFTSTFCALS